MSAEVPTGGQIIVSDLAEVTLVSSWLCETMKAPLVPAAAYVRMSTVDQQFSITNQQAEIEKYATQHGFKLVRTYSDAGKSGLALKYRSGLQELLRDVESESAPYQAILVYDVSRWGRFLDADEAAHYEFICKQSNIPLHYCAESFANDNTLPSAIFKTLKRAMAAEFSRELSVKVSNGLKRISALGFRTTGTAGYGLRRMLVSADGIRKQVLREGERKSIASDRVILAPGPQKEVQHVRDIFKMYAYGHMGVTEIVRFLTSSGVPFPIRGRKWTGSNIRWMLHNPKYVGMNVWGRTSSPLQGERTYDVPRSAWIVKDGAFDPIVDRATFDKVQRIFGRRRSKHYRYSDEQLLGRLKRLQQQKGKVTTEIIDKNPGPSASTYISRFGSLLNSYRMAGCKPPPAGGIYRATRWRQSNKLRREVVKKIKEALHEKVQFEGKAFRKTLLIDNSIPIALVLCRTTATPLGHRRWAFQIRKREMGLITLVCLCNDRMDAVKSIYLYPSVEKCQTYKVEFRIKENDPFLRLGTRLKNFDELYPALERLLRGRFVVADS